MYVYDYLIILYRIRKQSMKRFYDYNYILK